MRPEYIEAMYLDLLKTRSPDELCDLVRFIFDILQKKGCKVIGKVEITKDE